MLSPGISNVIAGAALLCTCSGLELSPAVVIVAFVSLLVVSDLGFKLVIVRFAKVSRRCLWPPPAMQTILVTIHQQKIPSRNHTTTIRQESGEIVTNSSSE
eukprot:TRINITY_DN67468_c3_g1_i1.p2 TRINITY_DN67468_c3_g1~~TRINITY_DN67468_c3_g1_i1.p2  ORF type:complete len:101 (-),score=2.44 TRINITY_DN67468_c3_g1_i1:355-657(-)